MITEKKPPLILHVIHHLFIGGMENGLVNLINNIPSSAYRHAIACIEDYSDFRNRITQPDVDIFALHRSRIGTWKLRFEIYRLCKKLKPAIVHTRNLSGLDALLPAKFAGVPQCIHGEHGWDVDNLDGRKWRPALLRRLHSPFINRYITVSKDLEQYLINRVGISRTRITQIYNGVDTDRFAPPLVKSFDGLPIELHRSDLILIGTVGRIQPVKDHVTLVHAFAHLIENHSNFKSRLRLIIVGDGPLLTELRAVVHSLKLDSLVWLPGALKNIPDILRTFDVFVLPSLNEGISNTILEAMATGLPIVASAAGGNSELVDDGVCGQLFPTRDIYRLSQILARYTQSVSLRQKHGQTARQVALAQYSLQNMVMRYKEIYDTALQSTT